MPLVLRYRLWYNEFWNCRNTSAFRLPESMRRRMDHSATLFKINKVCYIVGKLRLYDKLDALSLLHFSRASRLVPYRKSIFYSAYQKTGDPEPHVDAVRECYEAQYDIHGAAMERTLTSISIECNFGEYEPRGIQMRAIGTDGLRKAYGHRSKYIPFWV